MPKKTAQAAAEAIRRTLTAGPADADALAEARRLADAAAKAGVTDAELGEAVKATRPAQQD